MNKEKSALVRYLSQIVLGVLALLLALVWHLRQQEKEFWPDELFSPGKKQFDEVFLDNPDYDIVAEHIGGIVVEGQTPLEIITKFSLWDAEQILSADQVEQQAKQRFAEALRHFQDGDLDKSMQVCEEILFNIYPPHRDSRDLVAKIKEMKEEQEEENPPES